MNNLLIKNVCFGALLLSVSVMAQDTIDLGQFGGQSDSVPESAAEVALNGEGNAFAKSVIAKAISDRFQFIDLAYVKADDDSSDDGWAAKYNWHHLNNSGGRFSVDGGSATLRDIVFEVDISGTYSYGDADNTEDYSTAKLSFAFLYGRFGELNVITRAASDQFQDCLGEAAGIHDQAQMLAAEDQCWVDHRIDDVVSDPGSADVLSLAFSAGLEGDQNYDNKHSTYGITGIYSRADFPTLRLGYDSIDAGENARRMALTDKETYDRLSAELGCRYQLIDTQGSGTWLYLSYRYFREMSAPASIKQAGLDEFEFVSAAIRFPSAILGFLESDKVNLYVRYTDGKMPFDLQSDQAVHLGFSTDIATLASLLAE